MVVLSLPVSWNDRIGRFTLLIAAYQAVCLHPRPGYLSPVLSVVVLVVWSAALLGTAALLMTRRDA